jgi:hypothetical protein
MIENPLSNQVYITATQIFKIIINPLTYTTGPGEIWATANIHSPKFSSLPTEFKKRITDNIQPKPLPPPEATFAAMPPITSTSLPEYQTRYNSPRNHGIVNYNKSCWIASSLQLIYSIPDLREFLIYQFTNNKLLAKPELRVIAEYIYESSTKPSAVNIFSGDYTLFYDNYGYNGQKPGDEGDVSIFLGTFLHYMTNYLQSLSSTDLNKPGMYNINFTYLFGVCENINEYYAFGLTKIKPSTKLIAYGSDEYFSSVGRYQIQPEFITTELASGDLSNPLKILLSDLPNHLSHFVLKEVV